MSRQIVCVWEERGRERAHEECNHAKRPHFAPKIRQSLGLSRSQ